MSSQKPSDPSGRAEKARRALLIAKAKNKAYCDIADDSLIETAVDYYRGHNDSLEVQALYYSAARLSERGEHDKALARLVSAEEIAENIDDFFYLAMTQRLISISYSNLYVSDKAEEYATKATKHFDQANKEKHARWCRLLLASALSSNCKPDSAIKILKDNIVLNDYDYNAEWHSYMSHCQYTSGNYKEAINNINWIQDSASHILDSHLYSVLCHSYIKLHKADSAKVYIHLVNSLGTTWQDNNSADYLLSQIHELEGDTAKAYLEYKRSQKNLQHELDVLLKHPYYNIIEEQLKYEKKQYQLQAKAEEKIILFIIIICIIIILHSIIIINNIKKRNIAKRNHIELLLRQTEDMKKELIDFESKEKNTNTKIELILKEYVSLLDNLCTEWYVYPDSKKHSTSFSSKIDKILQDINSNKCMDQFIIMVNQNYHNLYTKIIDACPTLTSEQKCLIIYLAIDMKPSSICVLLNKNKNSFAVYKHRLKKTIESSNITDKNQIISLLFKSK